MSTRGRRTRQARDARRDDIRRALLLSIEQLAAEGLPFADITVDRVASRAGISRAKFYVYFHDMADVLQAWFEAVTEELSQTTEPWFRMAPASSKEDLRTALETMQAAFRTHAVLLGALHDTALHDPDVRAGYRSFIQRQIDALTDHIERGQRDGFIASLPARETAEWLAVMAERMQREMATGAAPEMLEQHLDAFTEIVWRTLYAAR